MTSRRRCCCACPICEDDFDRGDDTDIDTGSTCGWTEDAGAWEIKTNTLRTSSSSAVASVTSVHPDTPYATYIEATLYGASGDELRILIDYADTSNYLFAQLTIGDPNGCLELYRRSGGSNTLLTAVRVVAAASTAHLVKVYWGEDKTDTEMFGAVFGSAILLFEETGTNDQVGLGTGTVAGEVRFDDFVFEKHQPTSPTDPPCNNQVPYQCAIMSDNFTRADDTDIGCSWDEDTGNWSIASNELTVGTTSAVALVETEHPNQEVFARTVIAFTGDVGDIVRSYLAWDSSSSNICAEVTIGDDIDGTGGKIALYDSGSLLASNNILVKDGGSLLFCISNDGEANAILDGDASKDIEYDVTVGSGVRAGVGTGSTNANVSFSSLSFTRGVSQINLKCPSCGDSDCFLCLNGDWPSVQLIEIDGVTNGTGITCCDNVNGVYLLDTPEEFSPTSCRQLTNESPGRCSLGTDVGSDIWFTLTKPSGVYRLICFYIAYYNNPSLRHWSLEWRLNIGADVPDCLGFAGTQVPFWGAGSSQFGSHPKCGSDGASTWTFLQTN